MPIFRFRVCWEDDDNIYRDIMIKSGQTFAVFNDAILAAFEFKGRFPTSFFESNDRWLPGREISSEVLANKRDAPALSMLKTPVSALVDRPEKQFLFRFEMKREWEFYITLISIADESDEFENYPIVVRSEGPPPQKIMTHPLPREDMGGSDERIDIDEDTVDGMEIDEPS